ncbi:MAG: FecR family protein [Thermoanaerobaculia bacterium]
MKEDERPTVETQDEETLARLLEEAGPREEPSPQELAALTAAARSAWQDAVARRRRHPRPRAGRWLLGLAAAAVLVLALGLWLQGRGPSSSRPVLARVLTAAGSVRFTPEGAIGAGSVVETAGAGSSAAGRASLRLTDGTVVRIDTGSRVRFASSRRLELERGALYADTDDGPLGERLEVVTALGSARDIGTRFEVRIEEPGMLRVRVREGRVGVRGGGKALTATAGREILLQADGTAEERSIAIWGESWHWTLEAAAPYEIEGRTLGELLDDAARECGWTVRFEPADLETAARPVVLHGTTGALTLDRAVPAVLPGAGLAGTLEAGVLTVRRAEG